MRAAVAGVGESALGAVADRSSLDLQAEAASAALRDAGLNFADVDAVLTEKHVAEPLARPAIAFAEYLGIEVDTALTFANGGSSAVEMLQQAVLLVEAGLARVVLVAGADRLATGLRRDRAVAAMAANRHPEFEAPTGLNVPAAYALVTSAYEARHGAWPEGRAAVAVAARRHAANHPAATQRDPLTVDDVLASRVIAEPLHLLECSLISDGGAAFVVARDDVLADPARIRVVGYGARYRHETLFSSPDPLLTGARWSGGAAFDRAGLSPADIDVAFLYDSFTITVLLQLEDLGLCPEGTARQFVSEGGIDPGGPLPTNTHGGLLAYAHPGQPGGFFHVVEAVRQLRGAAADRQVHNARTALVHGVGGMLGAHATAILRRED